MDNSPKTLRIGLAWHSMTSDNLGVGALTLAHLAILEAAAQRLFSVTPQFVVLGWKDTRPPYLTRPDLEVVELRMKDFLKPVGGVLGHLRSCDMVLDISAGDSFADIYGVRRYATMLATKALTLVARRPLVLSPQTIGPFGRAWTSRAALAVMRRADVVAARDDLSVEALRQLGYAGDLIAASDVALRLPFTCPEHVEGDRVRVGLNVSGLLFNGGYNRSNMFGLREPYDALIRALLARLTAREDLEVFLVPHVISDTNEVEDDYRVSLRLSEEFPAVTVAPKFSNPSDAKSYISGMDFFAGARMHACIAAFSSGVPVLPMAYSRKFSGLFGALGYDVLADCQNETTENILHAFDDAIERRAALALDVEKALAHGLDRLALYETAVTDLMRKTADRRS